MLMCWLEDSLSIEAKRLSHRRNDIERVIYVEELHRLLQMCARNALGKTPGEREAKQGLLWPIFAA